VDEGIIISRRSRDEHGLGTLLPSVGAHEKADTGAVKLETGEGIHGRENPAFYLAGRARP